MTQQILSPTQCLNALLQQNNPFFENYLAFYSSWYGGIVLHPSLMQLPIDDHMVHRGDGVFEAMKAVNGQIYLFDQHIERLFNSAAKIDLKHTWTDVDIKQIIQETLAVTEQKQASIRVFLSRGPGDFSANPYDAIAPQLYVVVMRLKEPAEEKYQLGVRIGKSLIPAKQNWLSQIKSCNYLPNVLMKKEAVDRGLDYVISVDKNGFITESATENIFMLDKQGRIIYPPFESILKGTTMVRVCELARQAGIQALEWPITLDDLMHAEEVLMAGTSINVLPVVAIEQMPVGEGKPGHIAKMLNQLLLADQGN